MMLKRAFVPGVFLGVLIAASSAWAGSNDAAPTDNSANVVNTPPVQLTEGGYVARRPLSKMAIHKPAGESRLFIKFRDDFKARVAQDKSLRSAVAVTDDPAKAAAVADGLNSVDAVRSTYGLTFTPAINSSENDLTNLQQRAAEYSGKAQPDLAGMMYVSGPDHLLQRAAEDLQALDVVEYVYFQLPWHPYGGTGACCVPHDGIVTCGGPVTQDLCVDTLGGVYQGDGTDCAVILCPDVGACCLNTGNDCVALTEIGCTGLGGAFHGVGTNCSETGICDQPDCGNASAGNCFVNHSPAPFCNDQECCQAVCVIAPYCCDDMQPIGWDDVCVAVAN